MGSFASSESSPTMAYTLGLDIGGTNTDLCLLRIAASPSQPQILGTSKHANTLPLAPAIASLLHTHHVPASSISTIALGTTAFINALLTASPLLHRVIVLRLSGDYGSDVPPLFGWPSALTAAVDGGWEAGKGGCEVDGSEIEPLDMDWVKERAKHARREGAAVAVVGVFSPIAPAQEEAVRAVMEVEGVDVVCSASVGSIGFLERENAAILTAALRSLAREMLDAVSPVALGLPNARLFLTTNAGTLLAAERAAESPVRTFTCGPTNSIAGAAFLVGASDDDSGVQIVVVDIGGTTSDIGCIPLKASGVSAEIVPGVRISSDAPAVQSIPLGGGSVVTWDAAGGVTVGPQSLGSRITVESLLAGGETCTLTDIAAAFSGSAPFGDIARVAGLPKWVVTAVREKLQTALKAGIDSVRTRDGPTRVLLVGGGACNVDPEMRTALGVCEDVPHAEAANAVGAAMAGVEGTLERVFVFTGDEDEEAATEEALKTEACELAVKNGADADTVKVTEVRKLGVQYVAESERVVRFLVRAVGRPRGGVVDGATADDVRKPASSLQRVEAPPRETWDIRSTRPTLEGPGSSLPPYLSPPALRALNIDAYTPRLTNNPPVWHVTPLDLHLIALGCGLLSCGGGGSLSSSLGHLLSLLTTSKTPLTIIPPSSLPANTHCLLGSNYGAPTVSSERLAPLSHLTNTQHALLSHHFPAITISALLTDEIGGGNGLAALLAATHWRLPVVDSDTMGRAYPSLQHATPYLPPATTPLTPLAIGSRTATTFFDQDAEESIPALESRVRIHVATHCGRAAALALAPMSVDVVRTLAIPGSLSRVWTLGRALAAGRSCGRHVFAGRVTGVSVADGSGYAKGAVTITAPGGGVCKLPFMNEFLLAEVDGEVVVAVPDLVAVVDEAGVAVGVEEVRWGLRVRVVALRADWRWRTEGGLRVGGLEGFGMGGVEVKPGFWDGEGDGDGDGGNGGDGEGEEGEAFWREFLPAV
ncbi:hypothetical protein EDC01DRAFT_707277 [Geopyxis carbonaria]|nr:hypothetical protein EDC01DRAFT_707277 [Geopyxis carbonaria]